jgi:catechol 2,3-dioxygenase-like lactoylglutathione lyase family enzyme
MLALSDMLTTLPASDIVRAKRFYEDKLGLVPVAEDPGGVHYRSGSTWFDIYPSDFAGIAQHTLAGWVVEDIDGKVEELRGRGVVFEEYDFPGLKTVNGIAELETERAAWFKDSEGNILALAQITADFRS